MHACMDTDIHTYTHTHTHTHTNTHAYIRTDACTYTLVQVCDGKRM